MKLKNVFVAVSMIILIQLIDLENTQQLQSMAQKSQPWVVIFAHSLTAINNGLQIRRQIHKK